MNIGEELDFSSILASTIHDMKNSLGIVLNSLEDLHMEINNSMSSEKISKLQYEAKRVNNNLIQLLTLYKMENTGLKVNISDYSVSDFLEDCMLQEKPILDSRNIDVTLDCAPDIWWYFDRNLMQGVVGNAINNAIRYTKGKLRISAEKNDGYLVIRINDNGEGFPESMLDGNAKKGHGVSFTSGHTGLGLYFSHLVVNQHKNKDKKGCIELVNGGELGGGNFTVYLP